MKSFVITLGIFFLMLAIIMGNAVYINKTVLQFIDSLQILDLMPPKERQIKLVALQIQWKKEKNIIQASVSHTKIDTVSDLLDALIVYNEYQKPDEYKKTAALLRNAFEELRLLEEISAANIL